MRRREWGWKIGSETRIPLHPRHRCWLDPAGKWEEGNIHTTRCIWMHMCVFCMFLYIVYLENLQILLLTKNLSVSSNPYASCSPNHSQTCTVWWEVCTGTFPAEQGVTLPSCLISHPGNKCPAHSLLGAMFFPCVLLGGGSLLPVTTKHSGKVLASVLISGVGCDVPHGEKPCVRWALFRLRSPCR